jgi:hypothetical protein
MEVTLRRSCVEEDRVISTSNSVPLVGGDRKAFGVWRFSFPALAAMSVRQLPERFLESNR